MRKHWLGLVTLLLTVGCTHEGKLRPQVGAVPLSEDGNVAVTGEHGVRLRASGSSWKGQPGDIERHFTLMQVQLENHSGRPLGIQYAGFELEAHQVYTAKNPKELGNILSARSISWRPSQRANIVPPKPSYRPLPNPGSDRGVSYSARGTEVPAYTPPPCLTCPTSSEAAAVPSPDMLRTALQEGPLENGQSREGFLYFEEPIRMADRAILKVKLVDATSGEQFGTLSIPFEVR